MVYETNLNLNNEVELILYCARTNCDDEVKQKISYLLHEDINWIYLLQKARIHEVMPLLYWNLKDFDEVPNIISDYLKIQFEENIKKNLILTGDMFKVLNLLKSNNINAIPYKGSSLAILAYGNLALRSFEDIDVFVQEGDVKKVKKLLSSNGYVMDFDLDSRKEDFFLKHQREFKFKNENGVIIEVHWKIPGLGFSFPYKVEDNLETNYVTINGHKILNFSVYDLLLILFIHAAGHYWVKIKWICDIVEVINNHDNLNWNILIAKAKKLGIKRIMLISLFLANDLLDLRLPEIVSNEVKEDNKIEQIVNKIKNRINSREDYGFTIFNEALLKLRMREDLFNGIKDSFKVSVVPDYKDLEDIKLPSSLIPLYYLYRPIRLLKNYNLFSTNKFSIFDPTPTFVVDKMLEIANIGPDDVLYDLGCGDGRIVINAAKKYGIRAVGIDIDPKRIKESKKNAIKEGVEDLTEFINKDALKVDLSQATIVTLYLYPSFLRKLSSKFKRELCSNSRIVAHGFEIIDWKPIDTQIVRYDDLISGIYLYKT
ncbi:nucleotidyltransferase family protein [Methanobacterium sp. ACI-7]|uniref:nucleotidyltransferase family protein n=1 Tax=unclassified Methanobacterium TaxID=2627676 RepID=UPI0039C2E949